MGGPIVRFGEDVVRGLHSDLATAAAVGVRADGAGVADGTEDVIRVMPRATCAHLFHHRYSRGDKPESTKEKLIYHAAILLEWDHG
jgi:hypothetical protein